MFAITMTASPRANPVMPIPPRFRPRRDMPTTLILDHHDPPPSPSTQRLTSAFTSTCSPISPSSDTRRSSATGPRSVHSTGRVTVRPAPASHTSRRPAPHRLAYKISTCWPANGWNGCVTSTQPNNFLDRIALCDTRRDAQPAQLPPVLRDQPLPHRQRLEPPLPELRTDLGQERLHTHPLGDVANRVTVHASGAGTGITRDPFPRNQQERRVAHQVVQIIKAATRIGRRPTVQLGLHLPYPRMRCRTIHPGVFGHYSSLLRYPAAALRHVAGSPDLGLLRRLRPVPTRSADGGPNPAVRTGRAARGRTGTVPVFIDRSLVEGGARLYPRGIATATPWTFTVASRASRSNRPGSCPPQCQPRADTHRSQPRSVRFELVGRFRGLHTPVPHVHLFNTLAEPAAI